MRTSLLWSLAATLLFAGCGKDDTGTTDDTGADDDTSVVDDITDDAPAVEDELGLDLVLPATELTGLASAAEDLVQAFAAIKGVALTEPHVVGTTDEVDAPERVVVTVDAGAAVLGDQGYRIETTSEGLEVIAMTEVGAMYGLYDIVGELGVRYYHPEESFFPSDPAATLPTTFDGGDEVPTFEQRGFHEHTQHPTVWSDYFMRPGNDAFRADVSDYLRWLARNRQNAITFHLLKTVDLDAWIPYIDGIADEAHGYGIELGVGLSIADQQQNNFKLIQDDRIDEATGEMVAAELQITEGIDRLFEADLDFLVLQIGTSEFTRPADDEVLGWLQTAMDHVGDNYPDRELRTWIHIFCGLHADRGGYFYHLPLDADERIGAWVHTTMFYTVDHPAPVYACDDFTHQRDFMEQASGERDQIFFPETAWWLGFDNNLPQAMPITGWSRAYDIQEVLPDYDIMGHMTFTTGREWAYWQYDHYLTRATWDADVGWDDYLAWIAPVYGERGEAVAEAIDAWTEIQVATFYEDEPLLYFLLAGELPQDELGERAGILARRPKPAFQSIYEMDGVAFDAWWEAYIGRLEALETSYTEVLDSLEVPDEDDAVYRELYASLEISLQRVRHTIVLYEGVSLARDWRLRREDALVDGIEITEAEHDEALAALEAKRAEAEAITEAVIARIREVEAGYRYPLELLTQRKPASLTSYPYGYLEETHSGFFWTRRDEQLGRLIVRAFDESADAWTDEPTAVFVTDSSRATMVEPDSALAGTVIAGFIPQMLFGLSAIDLDGGTMTLVVAPDHNGNDLPDEGTELTIEGTFDEGVWSGTAAEFPLEVRDTADEIVGTLVIYDPLFALVTEDNGVTVTDLPQGDLSGEIIADDLVGIVVSIGGIDVNGAENLVKGVYGLPAEDPLPERLPMHFRFTYEAL